MFASLSQSLQHGNDKGRGQALDGENTLSSARFSTVPSARQPALAWPLRMDCVASAHLLTAHAEYLLSDGTPYPEALERAVEWRFHRSLVSPGRLRKEHDCWLEQFGLPSKARIKALVSAGGIPGKDPSLGNEPCLMFKERGSCRFGSACKFAHIR